jgi:hypothetical protein
VEVPLAGDRVQHLCRLPGAGESLADGLPDELADMPWVARAMIEDPCGGVGWFLHGEVIGNAPLVWPDFPADSCRPTGIPAGYLLLADGRAVLRQLADRAPYLRSR